MTKAIKLFFCLFVVIGLNACSTRQIVDSLEGSTEQRLVTHSINRLISELPEESFSKLDDKKVFLSSHFIFKHPMLDYATARLKAEVNLRHKVQWQEDIKNADIHLDVYFTSLGTDKDNFGLTIPLPVEGEDGNPTSINVLSLEMFHGISEMYFYISEIESSSTVVSGLYKSKIRTDKIATPIITIPVTTLDRATKK